MIIKKISLENYRSHKNTSIELSEGINLILGENGRGKSSILEAIGIVIFDINDRSGRKTGKSFIRYGENSAKVEIDFIANDGREYSLKSIFHSKKSTTSILKDLSGNEEIKNKEELRAKLNELCGIKKDYTDVYDNIIIAKQNEFINIFKDKPAERERIFNKIFNTELYSEMYSGILKDIEDRYNRELEKIETERNIISTGIMDEINLLNEMQKLEKLRQELEKSLNLYKSDREKLSEEIYDFEKKEREIDSYNREILNQKDKIIEMKVNLKKNIYLAKKAKSAKKIVQENEEKYHLFISVSKELKSNRLILEKLKKIDENNKRLINKNEILNFELKQNFENLERIKKEIFDFSNEKKMLEKEILEAEIQRRELVYKEKNLRNILENIENIEKKINDLEKNKYSLNKQLEKNIVDLNLKKEENLKFSKENIYKKLEDLEHIKKKVLETRKNILVVEERIKALEDAKEKLSTKLCPLLGENCENIGEKNIDLYFSEKIYTSNLEVKNLKVFLSELENKSLQEKDLNEDILKSNFLETEIKKIEKNIEEAKLTLREMDFELEKEKFSIERILFDSKIESKKFLREEIEKTIAGISFLNLDDKNRNLKNISTKIFSLKGEEVNIIKINQKNEEEITKNKAAINEGINSKISNIEDIITELEEKEKKLQQAHNIYLENINISNTVQGISQDIELLIKNIYKLRELVSTYLEKMTFTKKILEKINLFELKVKFENTNSKIVELSEKLGVIREKIENTNMDLVRTKLQKKKLEDLLKRIKKLETKLYKTKNIRINIKGMGLKISKYMLESISLAASLNFNKITGRTEKILWTNELYLENGKEKENKYAVYLLSKDKKIAFENLSGGEQVAVAISLRETMTEYFSNSRFIILDEPTNNLDKERKKLLAEYIGEILNNLDQSIIVTHDNTFREMAEKIIEI